MKPQLFLLTFLLFAVVGCAPTPHETTVTDVENDTTVSFVWPDTLSTIPADVLQECYYDKTMADYVADTGFFAFEESWIEDQYRFVASRIQPLKLPNEWEGKKELCDMVAFYNFMEILHAVETDYDAYMRFNCAVGDIDASEEELKGQQEEHVQTTGDFFAELDRISLKSISDKELQKRVKTLIGKIKENESREEKEIEEEENIWDITSYLDELTESWLPDIFGDSVIYASWDEMSSPQY